MITRTRGRYRKRRTTPRQADQEMMPYYAMLKLPGGRKGRVREYDPLRATGSGEAVEGVDGGTLRSTALWGAYRLCAT